MRRLDLLLIACFLMACDADPDPNAQPGDATPPRGDLGTADRGAAGDAALEDAGGLLDEGLELDQGDGSTSGECALGLATHLPPPEAPGEQLCNCPPDIADGAPCAGAGYCALDFETVQTCDPLEVDSYADVYRCEDERWDFLGRQLLELMVDCPPDMFIEDAGAPDASQN